MYFWLSLFVICNARLVNNASMNLYVTLSAEFYSWISINKVSIYKCSDSSNVHIIMWIVKWNDYFLVRVTNRVHNNRSLDTLRKDIV